MTTWAALLLDLHMPGISGLELLRLLRARGLKHPRDRDQPGRRDPVQDAEALAAGASALLSKPFDDQQLLDLVTQGARRLKQFVKYKYGLFFARPHGQSWLPVQGRGEKIGGDARDSFCNVNEARFGLRFAGGMV